MFFLSRRRLRELHEGHDPVWPSTDLAAAFRHSRKARHDTDAPPQGQSKGQSQGQGYSQGQGQSQRRFRYFVFSDLAAHVQSQVQGQYS